MQKWLTWDYEADFEDVAENLAGGATTVATGLVESFFDSFKSELVEQLPDSKFDNLTDAHRLIADNIDNIYNRTRLHSTLDYKSPVAFEMAHRLEELASN